VQPCPVVGERAPEAVDRIELVGVVAARPDRRQRPLARLAGDEPDALAVGRRLEKPPAAAVRLNAITASTTASASPWCGSSA
jgi:hypothetical protein